MSASTQSISPLLAHIPAGAFDVPLDDWGPRVGADSGTPMTSGTMWYESADGAVQVGLWECTPGGWTITDRPDTETVRFLAGRARMTNADGTYTDVVAGDVLIQPKGWSGRWDILETVRKLFVIARCG